MRKIIFMTAYLIASGCGTIEMTIDKDPSISTDLKERIAMCRGMGEGQVCQSGGCFDSEAEKLYNAFVSPEKCEYKVLENYGPVLKCSMDSLNIEYCDTDTVCRDWYTWQGSFTVPQCEEVE